MAQVNEVKEPADVITQLKNEIAALKKDAAKKDGEITLLRQQLVEAKSTKQALPDDDKDKVTYQCVEKCFYENVLYQKGDLVRFPKGVNVPEWFNKV